MSAGLSLLNIEKAMIRLMFCGLPETSSTSLLFSTKTKGTNSHVCAVGLFSKLQRVLRWLLSLSLFESMTSISRFKTSDRAFDIYRLELAQNRCSKDVIHEACSGLSASIQDGPRFL